MPDENWEVVPGVGVGLLRFGAPREQLHALLGPFSAFRRSPSSDLTDHYGRLGLMLTCNATEGLYLIEMPDPSYVTFQGVTLGGPAERVVSDLRTLGVALEPDDSGWTFADGTVALYVPSSEPDAQVENVTLFAPGHSIGDIVTIPGGATRPPVLSHAVRPGHGIGLVSLGEPRAEVRQRLHDVMTTIDPPGSKLPIEDLFWEDGLVLQYDEREHVIRIFIVKADDVTYAGINIMPGLSVPFDSVRQTLLAHGHTVIDQELGLELDGTGIELRLSNTQTEWPLPVSAIAITARTDSPA